MAQEISRQKHDDPIHSAARKAALLEMFNEADVDKD